jgi:hypothetical protein
MNQQLLLENIATLPPFAQQEVFDFVGYLKQRYVKMDSSAVDEEWQQTLQALAEFRSQQKMSDRTTLDDVIAIREEARY